jgi:hypothetical protein
MFNYEVSGTFVFEDWNLWQQAIIKSVCAGVVFSSRGVKTRAVELQFVSSCFPIVLYRSLQTYPM